MIMKNELEKWKEFSSKAAKLELKFDNHINLCLKEIVKVFNTKIEWWDYISNGGSWDSGGRAFNFRSGNDGIEICVYCTDDYGDIKYWDDFEYSEKFPIKFLFMTPEEVRKEVQSELDTYIKEIEEEELKKKEKL